MNAEIISIGTELLVGDIVNTNAQYLSKELSIRGINVLYQSTVGDNPKRLEDLIRAGIQRSDLIITTGGLGPTQDDLTKETLAKILDVELVLHEPTLEKINEFFKRIECKMTTNNLKQAYTPKGCIVLENDHGTAPGIMGKIKRDDKEVIIILLPGPPNEMKHLMQSCVLHQLESLNNQVVESYYYKLTGIGESSTEDVLMDIVDQQTNPTIATYAKPGEVMVRLTANGEKYSEVINKLKKYDEIIRSRLNKYIYSFEDITLPEMLVDTLAEKGLTIAFAESCTGGLATSQYASISGASRSLVGSVVCYSNDIKEKAVNVNHEVLRKYGAVSRETAYELAKNIRVKFGSDIGIGVTGIAGPGGGTIEKPVGLVYTAISYDNQVIVIKNLFYGSRNMVQKRAVNKIYNMIFRSIH
jgi:nicotinamide-nucleotide amidase